jgi:hypothetical protein
LMKTMGAGLKTTAFSGVVTTAVQCAPSRSPSFFGLVSFHGLLQVPRASGTCPSWSPSG